MFLKTHVCGNPSLFSTPTFWTQKKRGHLDLDFLIHYLYLHLGAKMPRCQNAMVPGKWSPQSHLRILCTTRLAEGWDQPFLSTCLSPSPPDPHGKLRVSTCKKRLRSIENNTLLERFNIVRFIIAPLDWNITRYLSVISHESSLFICHIVRFSHFLQDRARGDALPCRLCFFCNGTHLYLDPTILQGRWIGEFKGASKFCKKVSMQKKLELTAQVRFVRKTMIESMDWKPAGTYVFAYVSVHWGWVYVYVNLYFI